MNCVSKFRLKKNFRYKFFEDNESIEISTDFLDNNQVLPDMDTNDSNLEENNHFSFLNLKENKIFILIKQLFIPSSLKPTRITSDIVNIFTLISCKKKFKI